MTGAGADLVSAFQDASKSAKDAFPSNYLETVVDKIAFTSGGFTGADRVYVSMAVTSRFPDNSRRGPVGEVPEGNGPVLLDLEAVYVNGGFVPTGQAVHFTAAGYTPTPGFSDIKLEPMKAASASGVLIYEFVGVPPSGTVLQVLTPASATTTAPKGTSGIIIKGKNRSIRLFF